MAKKKKTGGSSDAILIKRHGNRRLYNTETKSYVNYADLAEIVRDGHDIRVVDSKTDEDVTKTVLIQVILEEEKNDSTVLPTDFLFQVLRSKEGTMQDFFRNHLTTSFEAYMKTKEEFDNRFRSILEMAVATPQMMEKLIPGAEVMREVLSGKRDEESEEEKS
ncbi:MAG: polyhydroxyalkanoate synthesis repressor PhaR [Acidobacteria bacterium]|nr:MAG: polyhydroxyalkanoate synthesis repressor PhaR [Acidobacteriota bacterium]REJ98998.1 MAG: polyhydroxyalkanoate synthesis repressor PhaR [Acidobacteriota bacterium]REK16282.1 MAG: polyhydroxyalkanoate synthesis repressor PhaR [Acidobacteriota bacterium]REK43963.1 MAG: polyhydroxyalkanoate synthesis repressor PhaR [Acidobacteriota bacterium]